MCKEEYKKKDNWSQNAKLHQRKCFLHLHVHHNSISKPHICSELLLDPGVWILFTWVHRQRDSCLIPDIESSHAPIKHRSLNDLLRGEKESERERSKIWDWWSEVGRKWEGSNLRKWSSFDRMSMWGAARRTMAYCWTVKMRSLLCSSRDLILLGEGFNFSLHLFHCVSMMRSPVLDKSPSGRRNQVQSTGGLTNWDLLSPLLSLLLVHLSLFLFLLACSDQLFIS